MRIKLEFSKLTISLEAKGVGASLDAIMLGASLLAESQKLGYGKPKLTMHLGDLKSE